MDSNNMVNTTIAINKDEEFGFNFASMIQIVLHVIPT